jgi:carbamoyl-phosphate synthase large subunit
MLLDKITVLVTGIGGYGAQIVKALKLAKTPYEIIGADMSSLCGAMQDVDHSYIISAARSKQYIDEILWICEKHSIKAVFPGTEIELQQLSLARERFENRKIFLPINSQNVLDICFDKEQTVNWLKKNGYAYPKTINVNSVENLEECDFYPVVLKPAVGGSGSSNLYLAQNKVELVTFGQYLLTVCKSFIIQEYVGSADSEYTVGVLCDMEGEIINSIAVKRNITSGLGSKIKIANYSGNKDVGDILAISTGITQGEIGNFPEVTIQCEEIAKKMGCKSPVNVQCRLVNDKVYIFEINPRFSGTTSFRAMVGYNEPDILVKKYLLGENIEKKFKYGSGYIVRDLREILVGKNTVLAVKDLR